MNHGTCVKENSSVWPRTRLSSSKRLTSCVCWTFIHQKVSSIVIYMAHTQCVCKTADELRLLDVHSPKSQLHSHLYGTHSMCMQNSRRAASVRHSFKKKSVPPSFIWHTVNLRLCTSQRPTSCVCYTFVHEKVNSIAIYKALSRFACVLFETADGLCLVDILPEKR